MPQRHLPEFPAGVLANRGSLLEIPVRAQRPRIFAQKIHRSIARARRARLLNCRPSPQTEMTFDPIADWLRDSRPGFSIHPDSRQGNSVNGASLVVLQRFIHVEIPCPDHCRESRQVVHQLYTSPNTTTAHCAQCVTRMRTGQYIEHAVEAETATLNPIRPF